MRVKDVMTKQAEVLSPDETVWGAAQEMRNMDLGMLPVCQNGRLIGIVTDRDITVRAVAEGKDISQTRVSEVMTTGVQWCLEDEDVDKVAAKMEARGISRLPVINREKKLVGVLSIGDLASRGSRDVASEILERVSVPV